MSVDAYVNTRPNLCKDCKYRTFDELDEVKMFSICSHPNYELINVINGRKWFPTCEQMRKSINCGKEGVLFEQKVITPEEPKKRGFFSRLFGVTQ